VGIGVKRGNTNRRYCPEKKRKKKSMGPHINSWLARTSTGLVIVGINKDKGGEKNKTKAGRNGAECRKSYPSGERAGHRQEKLINITVADINLGGRKEGKLKKGNKSVLRDL